MRRLNPERGLFPIGVAAEIIGVEPRVLRMYEKRGLVCPTRTDGNRRLYSIKDLEALEYVHYLTHVRRVNLAGVQVVLELLENMPDEMRHEHITSMEIAVDRLDERKRKLFEQGSELVEEVLLSEEKAEKLDREVLSELARTNLELLDGTKD
ncbi:MAG: MerR family transcriptional regulator [Deltaproteobacteria bacterium]|nr:MerR family transcriptional regulator [Deltaproteobacteria bacterium]